MKKAFTMTMKYVTEKFYYSWNKMGEELEKPILEQDLEVFNMWLAKKNECEAMKKTLFNLQTKLARMTKRAKYPDRAWFKPHEVYGIVFNKEKTKDNYWY